MKSPRNPLITLIGFALLLAISLTPLRVEAAMGCSNVDAYMFLRAATEGCTSRAGICTIATLSSPGGFLDGATWFFALVGATNSAGLPAATEPSSTLSYAGNVKVTPAAGTIMTSNVGVFDPVRGAFSQLDRVVGGTEPYDRATGIIFVTATGSLESGFASQVRGEICTNR